MRKTHLWGWALTFMIVVAGAQMASAKGISIELDNERVTTDVAPYLTKDNVTLVPLRVITEALGGFAQWNQADQTVHIKKDDTTIKLVNKQLKAQVDGNTVDLISPAQVKDGRMMVPLRFVGEAFGIRVQWHQDAQLVRLWTGKVSEQPLSENVTVSKEMRGAWIATINGDWPSKDAVGHPERQKEDYITILNQLKAMGIQDVFVQVRAAGDAIYPSNHAPWNKILTGTQGKDPGYDPLAFMIEETHKRGMTFHAWFNPFRATTGLGQDLASNHVAKQHPEWIVTAGGKLYLNPGDPDAREHIIASMEEVVRNYDVDGVHLDDYFYPSNVWFNDDTTFALHNTTHLTKADWRRQNINVFVKELGEAVHQIDPNVSYGISPFGVWRNIADDPTGSATTAGVPAYDIMFADVRTWIKEEWIDYVAPQIYWSIGFTPAAYDVLVEWWANEVKGTDVKLYIGHAPYKIGTTEAGWSSATEIIDQLKLNESFNEVDGSIFFSSQYLLKPWNNMSSLLKSYYRNNE
ncbi:family 10 glycosylhydrolase [Bacillaceae bacterium SIJ1]|uniref:family 10 glycosylhydrolase n=1 Tax=Litoribacterium kuwaitense TaxID=1398745 RepID=UPI0013EBD169|nr:family 10 glycosylhydrolase [Litoribacterium kuwaitense]NGP45299.1 family 10 glycosylhydrolase [Litoribacterium kuwaitense]